MEQSVECLLRGRKMKRMVEAFSRQVREHYNLKQLELEILYFIYESHQPLSSKNICELMNVNKGHLSGALAVLIDRGYLEAQIDTKDRRVVWNQITEEGIVVVRELEKLHNKVMKDMQKGITPEEREIFQRVSERIMMNMDSIMETFTFING